MKPEKGISAEACRSPGLAMLGLHRTGAGLSLPVFPTGGGELSHSRERKRLPYRACKAGRQRGFFPVAALFVFCKYYYFYLKENRYG